MMQPFCVCLVMTEVRAINTINVINAAVAAHKHAASRVSCVPRSASFPIRFHSGDADVTSDAEVRRKSNDDVRRVVSSLHLRSDGMYEISVQDLEANVEQVVHVYVVNEHGRSEHYYSAGVWTDGTSTIMYTSGTSTII